MVNAIEQFVERWGLIGGGYAFLDARGSTPFIEWEVLPCNNDTLSRGGKYQYMQHAPSLLAFSSMNIV